MLVVLSKVGAGLRRAHVLGRGFMAAATVAATLAATLAGCGGGTAADAPAPTEAMVAPAAAPERRPQAANSAALDASALFAWAERTYPSLFPAGPKNEVIDYGGTTYTVRHYPSTQNYLGVSGQSIYGLGGFTGGLLTGFGQLSDWRCQVLSLVCLSGRVVGPGDWSGATVQAHCRGDDTSVASASTAAGSEGGYTLDVNGARLPCVLRATARDGRHLHAVASGDGTGSPAAVQITPLTDLLAAYQGGVLPEKLFDTFCGCSTSALSPTQAELARTAVTATLKAAGVDFSAVADPVRDAPGDDTAYGRALAQLMSRLTGGLSQATLADAMTRRTPQALAAAVPSLPADLLLAPAVSTCSALRGTTYRAVYTDSVRPTETLTLDAGTLVMTPTVGSTVRLTPAGRCHFSTSDGGELAVSDAGVVVGRLARSGSGLRGALLFPEQPARLADLAGTWIELLMSDGSAQGAGWIHAQSLVTDAEGRVGTFMYCGRDAGRLASDCSTTTARSAEQPVLRFAVHLEGGFALTRSSDGSSERRFLYRSGSGAPFVATAGRPGLGAIQAPLVLPASGESFVQWSVGVTTSGAAPVVMSFTPYAVISVDVTGSAYARNTVFNSATGATRPERLEINRFFPGYAHRIGETVTGSDGSQQLVTEFLALQLPGAGLAGVGLLGSAQAFALSVTQSTAP